MGERRARYRRGLAAEIFAAAYLGLLGYRVLARRFKTRSGELDLVAVRGGVVAFVEVKARRSQEAAEASITARQSRRMRRAAGDWMARNRRYGGYEQRFDALFLVPWQWPRHIPGGA